MWGDHFEMMETLAEAKAVREQDEANARDYKGIEMAICPQCNGNGCRWCGNKGELYRAIK